MGSSIPRSGHQTCGGTEERASLASVSTIVVVAGQTQVHDVTLATVRPAIVPPIVPGPPPSGMQRRRHGHGFEHALALPSSAARLMQAPKAKPP